MYTEKASTEGPISKIIKSGPFTSIKSLFVNSKTISPPQPNDEKALPSLALLKSGSPNKLEGFELKPFGTGFPCLYEITLS